jgi:hypothetical protein
LFACVRGAAIRASCLAPRVPARHGFAPANARKLHKVSGNPDNQRFLHVAALQHACRTPRHSMREIDDEIRNSYASFKFAARRAPLAFAFSVARERGTAAD